jgi:hypothetical protein
MRRVFVYLSWLAFLLNVSSVCSRFEQMQPGALAGMGFSFLLTILTFGFAILASGIYRQKSGLLVKTEIDSKH